MKAYSGFPFSITTGTDSNDDGNTTDRANLLGNPYGGTINHSSRAAGITRYFNTSAFCAYTTTNPANCPGIGPGGSDGTSGRNAFYGPAFKDVDLAILRDFHIYERVNFELRGESTNVLNSVEIDEPKQCNQSFRDYQSGHVRIPPTADSDWWPAHVLPFLACGEPL